MASYILEFKWPDYKFLNGSETTANSEEQALRNIIFRNERLRKNRTKGELALLADKMINQDAFIAYDTTEYRAMRACVADIKEAIESAWDKRVAKEKESQDKFLSAIKPFKDKMDKTVADALSAFRPARKAYEDAKKEAEALFMEETKTARALRDKEFSDIAKKYVEDRDGLPVSGANQTVQEIGGDVGLPVDRELAIPYNQGKAKPDGDDRHNHFYKDVNEVQDPFQF